MDLRGVHDARSGDSIAKAAKAAKTAKDLVGGSPRPKKRIFLANVVTIPRIDSNWSPKPLAALAALAPLAMESFGPSHGS
jgi:hypothetical protein